MSPFVQLPLALVVSILIVTFFVQGKRLLIASKRKAIEVREARRVRKAIERREDVMRYREERGL